MKLVTDFIKAVLITGILVLNSSVSSGQTITVNELVSPDAIKIFYIGDFSFDDASNNPIIFQYRIAADQYPQEVKMQLTMNATVPTLGLLNEEILYAETNAFTITNPITISNRVIDTKTEEIYDEAGVRVPFSVPITREPDADTQKSLIDAVTRAGKLPSGVYTFSLEIISLSGVTVDYNFENPKIMEILNPVSLELVGPGSFLEDEVEIFTLFPIFQWESVGCKYFIRVSEYDPALHSSVEEALNDVASLPFPDDGSYFGGDDGLGLQSTSLQYPLSGAKLLEYGNTYVWSIKKVCVTTAGDEEINSSIFAFKIPDLSGGDDGTEGTGGVITDPVLSALQSLLGELFDALFTGDGELAGYTIVASILLNGETATSEAVSELAEMVLSGEVTAVQFEIED